MTKPSLVWLRQDLRLDDQPAIAAAAAQGPFAALYVLDDTTPGDWAIGPAQRWWLHHSLVSLRKWLEERGGVLVLRKGRCIDVVSSVAGDLGATRIHATRHYEPWWRATEKSLGDALVLHSGDTLVSLEEVRTASGQAYRIYTPFYRCLSTMSVAEPQAVADRFSAPDEVPASDVLDEWRLVPTKPDWAKGFCMWSPGERGARSRLAQFARTAAHYALWRDLPAESGTSMLSPHLHFGEISPRRVWHFLGSAGGEKFRKELAWRDFSRSAMIADPHIGEHDQRSRSAPWRIGAEADCDFRAWTAGRTGYPIVDAGMRQLWTIGWMHNRVRMIAASFLVKHLLIDWRRGARWFWDTLVDADFGNNSLGWQWIAGTGVDSQPFARIMAPLLQSAKFGAADYIREWVPELAHLDDREIHDPSGEATYPPPLITHRQARERALATKLFAG